MPTFSPNKNFTIPNHNEFINSWDSAAANPNYTLIDTCFSGTLLLNATGLSGTQALTQTNVQPPTIQISGAPTAAITYTVPASIGGVWIVRNTTTGGFAVGIASLAGGSTVLIPANSQVAVWCDGSATGMLMSNSAPVGHVTAINGTFSNSVGVANQITNYTAQGGNTGSWFNLVSGVYTPPAGKYFIMCGTSIQAPAGSNGTATLGMLKNGVPTGGPVIIGSGEALFSIPLTIGAYVDANGSDTFALYINPLAVSMQSQSDACFTAFPI